MKRLLTIALAALLCVVAIGSPGFAATGVGTGNGDVSILSVTQNLTGADQTVNIGTASGFATNDPPRNSLSRNKANVLLQLARAIGVSVPDLSAYDVHASVECDSGCESSGSTASSSGANETKTLPTPSQVATGQVVVGAKKAEAGRSHALASLSQVSVDANVFDGLVALSGASIDFSKLSDTSKASSSSEIGINSLNVLPFGKIVDLSSLSVNDLVALANAIDPTGALAGPVNTAKTDLYDTINSELATLNALGLGITISPDMSISDLITVAQTISGNTVVATTLPAFKTALDAAIAALQAALDALEAAIAGISLLSIEGLKAGSKSEAFVDHATASASVLDLGTVKVAGQTVAKPGDLTTYLNNIRSAVETLEAALRGVPVFSSLDINIALWETAGTGTSFANPYHVGVGKLSAFSVRLSYNPTFDVKVLSFNTRAEYKAVASTTGGPGGPGGPGLATTGPQTLWIVAGMLLIGLALKLGFSLKTVPQEQED